MTRLTAALAATVLAALRRLELGPIAGGCFGGVAGAAADPFPELSQLSGQEGELGPQKLDLLLLVQDQLSGLGWPQQPIRFWNLGRRGSHHRR